MADMYSEAMKRSKVISSSLLECPLSSTRLSRSFEDWRYASAWACCSEAVGMGGISGAGAGAVAAVGAGACGAAAGAEISRDSCFADSSRNSPSGVNSRRSVTIKLSCFFSGIVFPSLDGFLAKRCSEWQRRSRKIFLVGGQFFRRQRSFSPQIAERNRHFAPIHRKHC
jgi:hypothetical protein